MNVQHVSTTLPARRLQAQGILTGDQLIVYEARVSSPPKQTETLTAPRLLHYCLRKGHWSVFDMADMTVEVDTCRAISAQAVRHWSFDGIEVTPEFRFQEFSQRYAEVQSFETWEARRQDDKNRQSSNDDLPEDVKTWFLQAQRAVQTSALMNYEKALEKGIAKECARILLPMSAATRFYMKGTARSWIHYLRARRAPEAQKEHRDVANAIGAIFTAEFPTVSEAAFALQGEA
jgi:thymidylate synthase (FAD)